VYEADVRSSGIFTEEVDLSDFSPGIYIVKSSSVKRPARFIIEWR
jgi:hypothetical protein